jgi:hypothetical protein
LKYKNPGLINRHFISVDLKNEKQDLITADGGIEVKGEYFNLYELCCQKLFFSEILTAISVQKVGGTFILKIYDALYDITVIIKVYTGANDEVVGRLLPAGQSYQTLVVQASQ